MELECLRKKLKKENIKIKIKGNSDIEFAIAFSTILIILMMMIYYFTPVFFNIFNSLKDVMGNFKALVFTLALVLSIIFTFFGTLRR